jgi:hypothetical protein
MIRRIKDIYYSIKHGIHNTIRWIPTIWILRDWDAEYLYLLIYKHLSHVENSIRNYGHGINYINDANRIRVVKNLAKRLWYEEYVENALLPVEQKYGELKWYFEPSEHKNLNKLVFNETLEEKDARRKAYKHADYMKKQDQDLLFNNLNKYINGWWD